MKQSYKKEQHAIAKAEQRPLIVVGWNGKYMKKPQAEALFWGPVDEATLKEVQALFLKIVRKRK